MDRRCAREQQVRGEPVLGHRPRGLVGTDVVGEQDAAVDDRGVAQPGDVIAERTGSRAFEQRAEYRCGAVGRAFAPAARAPR